MRLAVQSPLTQRQEKAGEGLSANLKCGGRDERQERRASRGHHRGIRETLEGKHAMYHTGTTTSAVAMAAAAAAPAERRASVSGWPELATPSALPCPRLPTRRSSTAGRGAAQRTCRRASRPHTPSSPVSSHKCSARSAAAEGSSRYSSCGKDRPARACRIPGTRRTSRSSSPFSSRTRPGTPSRRRPHDIRTGRSTSFARCMSFVRRTPFQQLHVRRSPESPAAESLSMFA
jgi:hypothetical protein